MKQLIFYASHLYWLFAPLCLFVIWKSRRAVRLLAALALLGTTVLAYARFVEPRILNVHSETIILPGASAQSRTLRIALFADTHYGIFHNAMPANRIVETINNQDVDAVFLAGDMTYYPGNGQIESALAPFGKLDAPLFVVMGNHDVGFPGPDLTNPVRDALDNINAKILQNRSEPITLAGRRVIVAGLSDLWQGQQDFQFASSLPSDAPIIVLTHNPDTALTAPPSFEYDLMLAGHTHGGQIRLPGFIQRVIPTNYPFDKELHKVPTGDRERLVYVTSGTGMVGLPMRFNMPPRVDILTLHIPDPTTASPE